jgi:hypothetical protein
MQTWSVKTGGMLAWLLCLPCVAQQVQVEPARETVAAAAPAAAAPSNPGERSPAPVPAPLGAGQGSSGVFGTPLGEEKLSRMRGGTDTPWSDMKLSGTVTDNSAVNVVTGNNVINGGSFANSSGLPTVIQNSGSNVLIQNATIVNVQFQ